MPGKIYGYIRVSTKEQNEDRQRIAMEAYGVPEENVYMDKQSGKDFDRPGYRALMETLGRDDLFVIKSIDRLGRDFDEILEQWRIITKDKGAGIIVLDMPILNTGLQSDLLGRVVAEMMLTLMSYMAETTSTSSKKSSSVSKYQSFHSPSASSKICNPPVLQ